MTRRAVLAAVAVVALCMIGCAGAGGSHVRTVVVDVHHSRFSVTDLEVAAGESVRFVVRNHDPIPHELIVGDMAVQDVHERGTEAHHAGRPGEVSVAPGSTAETTYTFRSPGRMWFGCHLPGHWAYGMQGVVNVR